VIILGVDPGIQHTGWAVLNNKKVMAVGTLEPPDGLRPVEAVMSWLLPKLKEVITDIKIDAAVVEQVAWYGRARRITLPLSHISGMIVGFLAGSGIDTFLILASMRKKERTKASWDEHQKDAVNLARVGLEYLNAEAAEDLSLLKKRSAVGRRRIIAPANARIKE
jgi:Holliday junction resolvasome RuvABC endonuclease subunit